MLARDILRAMAFAAVAAALAHSPTLKAQSKEREAKTIWEGVYTREQATRGERVARADCLVCHSVSEWSTSNLLRPWVGRPILDWYDNLRMTMPYDAPGRLTRDEYAQVIAYMLSLNDAPEGDTPLPSDVDGLMQILVTTPDHR